MTVTASLQQKFPEWKTGSFAEFAVMQVMRYKRRDEYPALAQALLELHKGADTAEVETILNELGSLQQKVGMEFIIFLKSVDKSLVPHIHAGYGTPILAWVGLFCVVVAGAILLAYYLFGIEISGESMYGGHIDVYTFWVFFFIGLLGCGFFLKRSKFKKPSSKK